MPRDTLARRLKIALAEADEKDFRVAERAHVTPAWLGSVKQGRLKKNPSLDKLRNLARALDKPTSYFTQVLGYVPIEEGGYTAAETEAAILSLPLLTDEVKGAILTLMRASSSTQKTAEDDGGGTVPTSAVGSSRSSRGPRAARGA